MTPHYVVSGTDTGIGKTVFSAALAGALGGSYWKAIQSGLTEETDSAAVLRLGALKQEQILPEAYRLQTPASPHFSQAATVSRSIRLDWNRPRRVAHW